MPIDATKPYDSTNIFARILRGEIPRTRFMRTSMRSPSTTSTRRRRCISSSSPRGPGLVGRFLEQGSAEEIAGFVKAVGHVARSQDGDAGYRLLANVGRNGGQEVPHLHVHIFGGGPLGPMLAR